MGACTLEPNWLAYILACLVTFFGGLTLLLPFRLAWICCKDRRKAFLKHFQGTQNRVTALRSIAESILSGNSVASKAIVSLRTPMICIDDIKLLCLTCCFSDLLVSLTLLAPVTCCFP